MHFVLHIGPDKTGTSAVQKWFLDQSEELAEAGILYSQNGCGEEGAFNAMAAALLGQRSSGDPEDGVRKLALFQQDLAAFKGDVVLLSAEDFSYRLLKQENSISQRFGPKRVATEATKLVRALKQLGATRITVLVTLRNEGDRAVSRVVQTIQDLRLPQITPAELPPELEHLIHSHHFCTKALAQLGVDTLAVLYTDPQDARPLAARLLHRLGLAPHLCDAPLADQRINPSMGLSGCLAGMHIKDIIIKNRHRGPRRLKAGLQRGHVCLQIAYRRQGGHVADTPFNGVGGDRVQQVIRAQARINRVFADQISADDMQNLTRSKWADSTLSPMRASDLDAPALARTTALMDGFAQEVRQLPKAQEIYGAQCLAAFDAVSQAFKAEEVW